MQRMRQRHRGAGSADVDKMVECALLVRFETATATAHMWIDHPKPASSVQKSMLSGLLDTHPPLRQRIAILRAMEGIEP
jgi:Zn-dependent protease with chaperone function